MRKWKTSDVILLLVFLPPIVVPVYWPGSGAGYGDALIDNGLKR